MNPKLKYREVLIGFEHYSFSEDDIRLDQALFDAALHDVLACARCDGMNCRTYGNVRWRRNARPYEPDVEYIDGPRMYVALSSRSIEFYATKNGKGTTYRPHFAMYHCPGVAERKRWLKERVVDRAHAGPERS